METAKLEVSVSGALREEDEHVGWPLAYLITFRTYGTWLPGDERGSIDREHRMPGQPYVPPDSRLEQRATLRLRQDPVQFSLEQRRVVETATRAVCLHRGWNLEAVTARTNHVHRVVNAQENPDRVMNAFKSWGTRALIEAGLMVQGSKVWARHGSTRYLRNLNSIADACRYVMEHQDGESFNNE